MKLILDSQLPKLQKSGSQGMVPIVKFFNPCGAQTWLITGMENDGDTLWGYADLGFGCVEFGTISLSELKNLRLPFGLSIERDLHFKPRHTAEEYLGMTSLAGI